MKIDACCCWLLVFLGLAVVGGQAHAQAPRAMVPLAAEEFFRAAEIAETVLSPSGHRLAITMGRDGTRVGLFVIDLATASKPQSLVQYEDADVVNVNWVNDDLLIFSATDRSQGSGRVDSAPGLFSISADGAKVRQLVKRRYPSAGAALFDRSLDWNHWLLKVPQSNPGESNEEVLLGQYSWDQDRRVSRIDPSWLNVRTGLSRSTNFAEPSGVVWWLFDSRGEPRLVLTTKDKRQAAYWRGRGRTDWQLLVEGDLLDMPFEPHSVDDAGHLYVLSREGPEGLQVLTRYDFERKAPSSKSLISTPGFDFEGQLITDRGVGPAQGVRVHVDAETTVWFDADLKRLQAIVDERFPGRVNRVSCGRCDRPDAVALVRSYSDREPGQIWVYRAKPADGQPPWQALAKVMPGIDARQMAAVDFQRIKARDGRDLPVWLTLPRGQAPGKPAPAVVLVHGGPWSRGGYWKWDAMNQFLASRGYLVIEPEFRGSEGYGRAHFRAGWKQWGQAMQNDVADALIWAQQQGLASNRACIAGASYGGYSTLMGLVRHPDLYRCGVAWVAVTDLSLYVAGSWWVDDDISRLGRQYEIPEMVGDAQKDAAMIAANSPVLLADRIKAPLLLAFGEADLRVPLAHGERLRAALKKAGNEPEWVTYPGEGHSWSLLKSHVDFAQRVERFLARHLQEPPR